MDNSLQITGTEVQELQKQLRPKKRKKKQQRKRFGPEWVKLSRHWIETLQRSRRVSTYRLAHTILIEAFKQEHMGREVVLSTETTGMARNVRIRAADELVKLGLIKVRRNGNQALRVTHIIIE